MTKRQLILALLRYGTTVSFISSLLCSLGNCRHRPLCCFVWLVSSSSLYGQPLHFLLQYLDGLNIIVSHFFLHVQLYVPTYFVYVCLFCATLMNKIFLTALFWKYIFWQQKLYLYCVNEWVNMRLTKCKLNYLHELSSTWNRCFKLLS